MPPRVVAESPPAVLLVVEPGQRSVDSARRILRLCQDIQLKNIKLVANKVNGQLDRDFLTQALPDVEFLAFVPYTEELRGIDRTGRSVLDGAGPALAAVFEDLLAKVEA